MGKHSLNDDDEELLLTSSLHGYLKFHPFVALIYAFNTRHSALKWPNTIDWKVFLCRLQAYCQKICFDTFVISKLQFALYAIWMGFAHLVGSVYVRIRLAHT